MAERVFSWKLAHRRKNGERRIRTANTVKVPPTSSVNGRWFVTDMTGAFCMETLGC